MAIIETSRLGAKLFEENEIDNICTSNEDSTEVICKRPDKLKNLLNAISEQKIIQFISDGYWSMHDLIVELLKQYTPADLYFTTYALREFSVRQLITAIEKKQLLSTTILIDYKAKARTPGVIQLAEQNFNRIYLTNIHAKVTVLKTPGKCISILGSANWTSNPRIEAGVIFTDEKTANFHINWIEKIITNAEMFK